jgi:hypothetical protein
LQTQIDGDIHQVKIRVPLRHKESAA